jgi:hypothetical protein
MTDDSKIEWPYKHEHDHSVYTRCLECKSWGINLPSETRCGNCSAEAGVLYVPQCCVRAAYAEGRKAERERCARLAKLNCTVEEIVDMIMGGQDGE